MGVSEEKMKIVINNYFKSECNVNTSIREAFEKGFRIGVKKGLAQSKANPPQTNKAVEKKPTPIRDFMVNGKVNDEPQTGYDEGLKLFADILFDKDKSNQFLEECKAMGIEPQMEMRE